MADVLDADVRTSLYAPAATHAEVSDQRVRPSALNRSSWLRANHRWAFPALAPVFNAMRPTAETTILSTIGWAHFARPRGRSMAYWYAPARWLYQTDVYVGHGFRGRLVRGLGPLLRSLDRKAVRRIDRHVAISNEIASRLRSIYGIDAIVVHPPLTFAGEPKPIAELEPGFLLVVSRFMRYKNIDLVIETMQRHPDLRLVVAGSGPDEARLRSLAGPNVTMIGQPSDDELAWLYQSALANVTMAHEDFGLTPLEAASLGTPTVALRAGGFIDTIVEGHTGLFVDRPDPELLSDKLDELALIDWNVETLQKHALRFGIDRFASELLEQLEAVNGTGTS